MQMTLKHMDIALESAAEALAAGDKVPARFKAIWKTARGDEDRLGILAARSQLLDYLAACHILGDTKRYSDACDLLLEQSVNFAERFHPASEMLLVELSLALISKRRPLVRVLAKDILKREESGCKTLESFQARSLAALLDLDYSAVQDIAAALTKACEGKAFDKLTCSQGMLWAIAVQQLANGDGKEAERVLQELQQQHVCNTDRELAKLKRGGASAFGPFDILDLPAAALFSLIEDIGHAVQPISEAACACGYALGLRPARAED